MSYGNFKDPLGLVKRMVTSGNRVAHFTLLREAIGILAKPLDWAMAFRENQCLRQAPKSEFPILLILGGSRSGTTLLYQVITRYLEVSYFSNLSATFPLSPISATKTFAHLFKKPSGEFKNYFGSVSGFNGPNDGFPIWNRWLGTDRSDIPIQLSPEKQTSMRIFFRAWQKAFPQPFVNKNNRNSLGIHWFESCLDQPCYVEIRRHPVFVAQSLILSRETVQGNKRMGWGVKSKDVNESIDPLGYVDDICHQVFEVERELDHARDVVPPERLLSIRYEDLCADPSSVLQKVAALLGVQNFIPPDKSILQPFKNTNERKVSDAEWQRIHILLKKLYGKDFFKDDGTIKKPIMGGK